MTRSHRPRPPCGRCPYPAFSGRAAALNSAFPCAPAMARTVTAPSPFPLPPVPPTSRNGRGTARARRAGGRAGRFSRWVGAGSAKNLWISAVGAPKSLILEASAPTSRPRFATGLSVFATGSVFGPAAAAPLFSLSTSLKKKKKEDQEGADTGRNHAPRLAYVLPRVTHAAYFLGHGFFARPTEIRGNPWRKIFI
ncbi:Baseplate J family protein [Burkholderia gladioli]|nr:Baseplate J family protein [Burkholderia gladioli]